VKSVRILGLTIQDNMKWNEHINNIVKKSSKRLYMLRLLKRTDACIDTLTTVYIYTTIIRPVLEYACQVWHYNIQQYLCEDIEKIQKRSLRIHRKSMTKRWSGLTSRRWEIAEKNYVNISLGRILTMKISKIFYHKQFYHDMI
jgi:hypothetical protein